MYLIVFEILLLLLIHVNDLHPEVLCVAAEYLIIVQFFLLVAKDLKLQQWISSQNIDLVEMLHFFFFEGKVWILGFELCQY